MTEITPSKMLKSFGIIDEAAQSSALTALVDANVISGRVNRKRIAADKIDRAVRALEEAFIWHCNRGDCKNRAEAEAVSLGREPLVVIQKRCHICNGSPACNALHGLATSLVEVGLSRILVVGGTEEKAQEITEKSPGTIEWRFIDGTKGHDDRYYRYYRADRTWAHVIALWGRTPLDHKVSSHFDGKGDCRVIRISGTGTTSLCTDVMAHVERRLRPIDALAG